jgi:hypothetical protein
MASIQLISDGGMPGKNRICFPFISNRSREEIGEFGEQIFQRIVATINESKAFELVNRKAIAAGLNQAGLRADDLYVPNARRKFATIMENDGEQIRYFLFATIASATTKSNEHDDQRNWLVTLEPFPSAVVAMEFASLFLMVS